MITIVSGLPRSGTSMMMQMLAAGGFPVLSDGERKPDTDNPRGYLEWERIKQLHKNPQCIADAEGKVVKIISQLLLKLPSDRRYRVIFMQRPLAEVMKSQGEMLSRRGKVDSADPRAIEEAFRRHLIEVDRWLDRTDYVAVIRVDYHHILQQPKTAAESIAEFLETGLNIDAMIREVDQTLYRNRAG